MIGNFVGKGSTDTMLKSVYDTNNDGHVDIADSVEVGSGDVIKFGIDSQNRYGYIEDGEATVHPFADAPNEITYADWLLLTPQEQETGKWLVTGAPEGNVPLATTSNVGVVKPDGTTVTITSDGTISASGSATLAGLTDTTITSPSNGQVLTYNSTSSKWENQSIPDNSYALVGMGQVTSYSNKVANTNVYLHRAPKDGDRLFIWFPMEVTDSDAQVKIYDEASGTAYTLAFSFWASGWKLYGLCLLGIADDGLGNLGLSLIYNFEGGTNYTAGTGIEINGSTISNTAPNYGVDVDGATISSVSSGNLGTYVGESKYLILYFSASASPYSGGYTLTLSYSGPVAIQAYGTLYDGSSRYNSNISAGTMLLCEVTDTGTGSSADPVHVNIIGKIDPNSGSGGNTVSKTRYQISSSSWSSSVNSDGFYTLTATLNPAIGSSPDVYVAGSADGTQPTDTEKGQFAYVKRCKVNGSTLTLYASSKPSSTFYIWVEGVNGTGSGDIVGNVIQPNGESSGGGETYSSTETVIGTWMGKTLYRKCYDISVNISPDGSYVIGYNGDYDTGTTYNPQYVTKIDGMAVYTNDGDSTYGSYVIPWASRRDATQSIGMSIDAYGRIMIVLGANSSSVIKKLKITVEYTKS